MKDGTARWAAPAGRSSGCLRRAADKALETGDEPGFDGDRHPPLQKRVNGALDPIITRWRLMGRYHFGANVSGWGVSLGIRL